MTKPGTPLGQPERVNLLNPLTSGIGIVCANLTASGGMVSISEVCKVLRGSFFVKFALPLFEPDSQSAFLPERLAARTVTRQEKRKYRYVAEVCDEILSHAR